MSISKSKCDRKLPKLIMKLLLLLNFVFISLYISNDGPNIVFQTFLLTQKLGSSLYTFSCFENYPIHCFLMSISKSKCDKKLPKLIMKLLLLLNFVFISLYLSNDGPNIVFQTFLLEQKLGSSLIGGRLSTPSSIFRNLSFISLSQDLLSLFCFFYIVKILLNQR